MNDSAESKHAAAAPPTAQERDPYPKMILVCMGIALVLVTIIFGFIFFDFMRRGESGMRPVRPAVTQTQETPANP